MKNINIKRITIDDIFQLQKIGRQTFYETFSEQNTVENMQHYLAESFSVQKLTDELNSAYSQFYFAERDGQIIGYLKINFGTSQTELQDKNALETERIYVLKAFHGKQIGQALYEKAVEIAQQQNAPYLWLGVWEENKRAINFYTKNGFVEFDKHIFKLGDDEQIDVMMRKML